MCLSGVTSTPILSAGTPEEPPKDDRRTALVAVWLALLNESPDVSTYQMLPSPEFTATRSSPKLSICHTGTKLSLHASESVISGSTDGCLGVPYVSPPDAVPPDPSVGERSPPYSRAPYPSPDIRKSSWSLKSTLPAGAVPVIS